MSKRQDLLKEKNVVELKQPATETITISPPRFGTLAVEIVGTAPLVTNRFDAKTQEAMREAQMAGSTARSKKKRDPKDFQAKFEAAAYRFKDGGYGIHAAAFRNAMIDACRLVGYKMTLAKLSVFIEADGFDLTDGTPLVRIKGGKPTIVEKAVRNANGSLDLRWRPQWIEWGATLRVKFDLDQFTRVDVSNLLERAGQQVGIGEGRPGSKMSTGIGWGTFKIKMSK